MASSTPNINLTLPVGSENVSRQIINDNNTKIDTAIGAVPPGNDLQSQVTALNNNIATKQDKSSLFISGSGSGETQTFDISNKGFTNPIFMLTVGYSTKGMAAIIYINAINEANIAFDKISGVGDMTISSISYNGSGTISVTFSSNPYRVACLTTLHN
jgi:hypothetical protein